MNLHLISSLTAIAVLTGCATAPDRIAPTHTSPLLYRGLSCEEISTEQGRVEGQLQVAIQTQARAANEDAGWIAIGLLVPMVLILQGIKGPANDALPAVASLKGQQEALTNAFAKGC